MGKLESVPDRMNADLDDAWEVLAEPIQTTMRRYGVEQAYEKLKDLTRGQKVTRKVIEDFIYSLEIPEDVKRRLSALTPATYTGNAEVQAKSIRQSIKNKE